MSINISISVPTNLSESNGEAIRVNGASLLQNVDQSSHMNEEDIKRIIQSNIDEYFNLNVVSRLAPLENKVKSIGTINTSYIEDKFHDTEESVKNVNDLLTKFLAMFNNNNTTLNSNYNNLQTYTTDLENRLKSLEEYTKSLEQKLNQEVKKVEAIVVNAVSDPETIDVVSEGEEDVREDITEASTEISVIDGDADNEETSEAEEEAEEAEEAEEKAEEAEEEEEEEEEEEATLEEFEYKGNTYYKDEEGYLYTLNEEGEVSDAIGVWNSTTGKVRFYPKNNVA